MRLSNVIITLATAAFARITDSDSMYILFNKVPVSDKFIISATTQFHRNKTADWQIDTGSPYTWTYTRLNRRRFESDLLGNYTKVNTTISYDDDVVPIGSKLMVDEVFNISRRILHVPLYVTPLSVPLFGPTVGQFGLAPSVVRNRSETFVFYPSKTGMGLHTTEEGHAVDEWCDPFRYREKLFVKEGAADKWDLDGFSVMMYGVSHPNVTIRLETAAKVIELPRFAYDIVKGRIWFMGRVSDWYHRFNQTPEGVILNDCGENLGRMLPDFTYMYNNVQVTVHGRDYVEFPAHLKARRQCIARIRPQRDPDVLIAGQPMLRRMVFSLGRDEETGKAYANLCNGSKPADWS